MRTRVVWLTAFLLIGFIVFAPSHAQEVENILANGGFEDGVAALWGTWGDVTTEVVEELEGAAVPDDPIEGNFCLHVTVNSTDTDLWNIGLNQGGYVFEQGKKYTLSAFLKYKQGTLDINFKPELAEDPWTGYAEQPFTMTEEWTEISITTPVFSEDVSPAEIVFHVGFAPGDFWIDGIRWYEGDYVPPDLGEKSLTESGDCGFWQYP
ncbi:MAG: carbohydrate binding domain-containing protein [Phycisphaerae bacterium]